MTQPFIIPATEEEYGRMAHQMPMIAQMMERLEFEERRLYRERLALQEARKGRSRTQDQDGPRVVATGPDESNRTDSWTQDDARSRKSALYKLYLQNTTLGEIVDKIAKRFISGKWSIIPRPSLDGTPRKTKGKASEYLLLLDFFINCNEDEDWNQLCYKFAQDMMIFGESYYELGLNKAVSWPTNIWSLPTSNMDLVPDKYNKVKYYTFAPPGEMLLSPKKIPVANIFRTWIPHLLNPIRPFAVIEGMVNPLFSAQMMIRSNQATFQNIGSSAPVIYEMSQSSSSSMARSFQLWLKENSQGVNNAGSERILYGGTTAKALSLKPLDTEWLEGMDRHDREIKGRLHVPVEFNSETDERNFRFDVLNFLRELFLEKINFLIVQKRFGINDWVYDQSFGDYAADPYAERVKTVKEKRKEQQLEEPTPYDSIPLIALETHAQKENQRVGSDGSAPRPTDNTQMSKRLGRTKPGKGKDKKGTSAPPSPPDKEQ